MREFLFEDLLSVTSRVHLTPKQMQDVAEVLTYMMGEKDLWVDYFDTVFYACRESLLRQHPDLQNRLFEISEKLQVTPLTLLEKEKIKAYMQRDQQHMVEANKRSARQR